MRAARKRAPGESFFTLSFEIRFGRARPLVNERLRNFQANPNLRSVIGAKDLHRTQSARKDRRSTKAWPAPAPLSSRHRLRLRLSFLLLFVRRYTDALCENRVRVSDFIRDSDFGFRISRRSDFRNGYGLETSASDSTTRLSPGGSPGLASQVPPGLRSCNAPIPINAGISVVCG